MLSRPNDCLHAEDIFRRCYERRNGYFCYTWWDKDWKKVKTASCHRLVYEECFGGIPDGHVVMHTCDNPWCVQPAHLKTGTQRDNYHDAKRKGRNTRGSVGNAKLTEIDIPKIRERLKGGETLDSVARDFGVSSYPIFAIRKGIAWRHVK